MTTLEGIAEQINWVEMIPGGIVLANGLIIYPDEDRRILRHEIFAEMVKVKRSRFLLQGDRDSFAVLLKFFRQAGGYAVSDGVSASHSYPSDYAYFGHVK
jgi:hypothetical protein